MSNLASALDIKKEALRRAGERDDGTSEFEDRIMGYINYWYHSVLAGSTELNVECGDPWYWARSQYPGVLNIDPYYLGNGVQLTYGSVNGTWKTVPLDPIGNPFSLQGWYLKLSGGAEYYRVTSHIANTTAFTIDAQFNDATISGFQDVTGYHLDYTLSQPGGIIRLAGPMRVYRRQSPYADDTGQVDIIDKISLDRDYPLFRILQGVPDRAAITYISNDGTIKIRFNRVPAFATRCEYEYIPEATDLVESVACPGTVTTLVGGTSVVGVGTSFLSSFKPGDALVVGSETRTVLSISDNTHLVTDAWANANAGATYSSGSVVPIIPHEHRIVLVYGAAYNIMVDKNDNRAPEYKQLTATALEAMVQANRRIKANMQKDMGRLIARRDMTHYTRRYYAQEVNQ